MRNLLALSLIFLSAPAFADIVVNDAGKPVNNAEKNTPILLKTNAPNTENREFVFASLNAGYSFASHLWRQSSVGDTSEGTEGDDIIRDTQLDQSYKAGFSLGYHWKEGYGAELEYAWHPLEINTFMYNYDYYTSPSARADFIFANAIYESKQFATKYKPHLVAGLGFTSARYTVRSQVASPISTYDTDTAFAAQFKIGFDKSVGSINEAFSWGVDYGYIRTLQDLSMRMKTSDSTWVDLHAKYSTQFLVWHFTFRF